VKKSVQIRLQKERKKQIEEINAVIRNAVKNFDFLSTLIVEGDPEATYHKIMDFREAVEQMIEELNQENKKGEA
jgi:hypothetical protein